MQGVAEVQQFQVQISPRGPRGSDSKSKSSNFETITDWPRREPVGRRRALIGEARVVVVVRGVEVVMEGFCCVVERLERTDGEGCGSVEPNRLGPDAKHNY